MLKDHKYLFCFYFSVSLLVLVAGGVFFGFTFLKSLFETAVAVNSVIVTVFLISLFCAYRYILLVRMELSLLDDFTSWCDSPENADFNLEALDKSIFASSLGAVSCSVREHGLLVLNSTSDSRSIVDGLEENLNARGQFISFMSGFLVLLGLLGTFLGLTITLQSMGQILTTLAGGLNDASDTSILKVMTELIIQLKEPMNGMGTAFSTSLFGLAASAVVGVLGILLRRMHDYLKGQLEKWLNERTELQGKLSAPGGGGVEFPSDQDLSAQLASVFTQMNQNNETLLEALDTSNKYLLKLILLQQQTVKSMGVVREQTTEMTKELGVGNELSGRLIKESRQIATTIERNNGIKNREN